MYGLDNSFASHRFAIIVVGCGGTGGFVAEGLCRLLPPQADLLLVDHDRVEEANMGRQNFARGDLGRFKSEALAKRLASRFERPVGYSIFPIAMAEVKAPGLVIGCVDNGPARREIAEQVGRPRYFGLWWVDAGNGENYGQVLVGSHHSRSLRGSFDPETGTCFALPLPSLQRPEILAQRAAERDCAEATASGEQGPVINQAIATLVVEATRRLIEGTCPWMQLYLDLEVGTLSPVLATPEAVAKITGIKETLLTRGGEHERGRQGGHRRQGR